MLSKSKKILIPISNRAHYGRLRSVLQAINNHPNLDLQIVVGTPAAYDYFLMNIKHSRPHSWRLSLPWYLRARMLYFIDLFKPGTILKNDLLARSILNEGYKIDARVPLFFDGGTSETMAKSVGIGIMHIVDVLKKLKPDIVFVNADRFEMMAVALAAAYLNIPIAHNEGGDLSGTIDESIRHSITKLSHIHFTATEISRQRVIQMGENPHYVFNVGSPAIDVLKKLDLKSPFDIIFGIDLSRPYLLGLLHPVATESSLENKKMAENFIAALEEIALPTLLLGSNIDAGSDAVGKTIRLWLKEKKPPFVFYTKTLLPDDFYKALANAACAVGNSSSFIREGAYLGTPAVIVGSRQRNREMASNVKEVDAEKDEIKKAVLFQLNHGRYPSEKLFGDGTAGEKIADILYKTNPKIQKYFHQI